MEWKQPEYENREMEEGDKHPIWPWWRVMKQQHSESHPELVCYFWQRLDGVRMSHNGWFKDSRLPVQGRHRSEVGPDMNLWLCDRDEPLAPSPDLVLHIPERQHLKPSAKIGWLTEDELGLLTAQYAEIMAYHGERRARGLEPHLRTAYTHLLQNAVIPDERAPPGTLIGVVTKPGPPTRPIASFDEYQAAAVALAIYPDQGTFLGLWFAATGTEEERGEVLGAVKKQIRDVGKFMTPELQQQLKKEVGDQLWYLANVCREAGFSLGEAARENIVKVTDRKRRGKIKGSGDDR